MAKYPGFVGQTYRSQSKIAADDRTINLIPSKIESGTGPATWVFDPAPGFQTYCTLADGLVRGFFSLNGGDFAIGNTKLYELPSAIGGTPIQRGTHGSGVLNLDNTPVSMAGNGDGGHQIMIASCSKLYCFNVLTDDFTEIADMTATFVAFQDGYFIALDPNTSTFFLSALENGLDWDPLDANQRNDSPDKWLSMITRPKEVWLFGSETTSVYYNSGDADTPFIPNPSVAIPYGTPAPYSVGLLYGSPIWLANDLTVRYANGYTAQRVSNHAVEYAISQYALTSIITDADNICYEEQGHAIYILNFPTAGASWAFDLVSGMWHERTDTTDLAIEAVMPVWQQTYANNANLVGSRVDGTIYQMSQSLATNIDGVYGLRWVRRAPHLNQEHIRITYDRLEVLMETGLGLASGQGSNPLIMLRWSDDGGQTWSNVLEASVGATGAYSTLVFWTQLGQARDRVFEVSGTDPISWRIVDAFLKMRMGTS